MSILTSELIAFPAAHVSATDPTANGGRPADEPLPLNRKNNVFPDVNSAARAAGGTRRRKVFLANHNPDDLPGEAVMVIMDKITPYDDFGYFVPGDYDDFESDLTGDEPMHGAAVLQDPAEAGADLLTVALESGEQGRMFAEGGELLVSSRSAFDNVSGTAGVEELVTIGSRSFQGTGNTVCILRLNRPLENAFAAGSRVSTVYRPPDLAPTLTGWTETGSGTYDRAAHPVGLSNRGTIRQKWTITYTSATTFTAAGDDVGPLGTFQTSAECAPVNPANVANGAPYFRLAAAGHGDGHAAGDKIEFWTSPASCPIWLVNAIPPGLSAYGLSELPIGWQVESPE